MDVFGLWDYLRQLGETAPDRSQLPQPDAEDEVLAVVPEPKLADRLDPGDFSEDSSPIWIRPDDLPILPEGLRPGVVVDLPRAADTAPRGDWESEVHACAWYRQITFSGPGFGIFIRQDCMLEIAEDLAPWVFKPGTVLDLPKIDLLVRLAFNFLYLHEQFHHKVESFAIRLAVAERRAVYGSYWRNVYAVSRGSNRQLEEALANADAFHRFAEPRYARVGAPAGIDPVVGTRDYLRAHFRSAPPGYRQAFSYLTTQAFDAGKQRMASLVSKGAYPEPPDWQRWQFATHMFRGIFPVTSSIWVVVARGSRPLVPTTAAPLSISSKEVVRILPRLNYRQVPRQGKGSHQKWEPKSGSGHTVEVPFDRDIPKGTLNQIAKDLGFINGHQLALACRSKSAAPQQMNE